MVKILALCETHAIGIIPHFTGPLSTAALVNVLSTYSKPVLFEYNYGDQAIPASAAVHGLQERQAVHERAARVRRHRRHGTAENDQRSDHAGGVDAACTTGPTAHLRTGRLSCVQRAGSLFWERNLVDAGEVVVGEDSGRSPCLNSSIPNSAPICQVCEQSVRDAPPLTQSGDLPHFHPWNT